MATLSTEAKLRQAQRVEEKLIARIAQAESGSTATNKTELASLNEALIQVRATREKFLGEQAFEGLSTGMSALEEMQPSGAGLPQPPTPSAPPPRAAAPAPTPGAAQPQEQPVLTPEEQEAQINQAIMAPINALGNLLTSEDVDELQPLGPSPGDAIAALATETGIESRAVLGKVVETFKGGLQFPEFGKAGGLAGDVAQVPRDPRQRTPAGGLPSEGLQTAPPTVKGAAKGLLGIPKEPAFTGVGPVPKPFTGGVSRLAPSTVERPIPAPGKIEGFRGEEPRVATDVEGAGALPPKAAVFREPGLGEATQRSIDELKRKQQEQDGQPGAQAGALGATPDMDALRELMGRSPNGAPINPRGFTRGQRLAAGFLAAAAPHLYKEIVSPEVGRRDRAAREATILREQQFQAQKGGQIVLAQLEGQRLDRESREKVAAAKAASDSAENSAFNAASLIAVSGSAMGLVKQVEATIAQLEGPGADQGRKAYAQSLREQVKGVESMMAPFMANPGLMTPRVLRFMQDRLRQINQNAAAATRVAATAMRIPSKELSEYIGNRDVYFSAVEGLKLLEQGSGFLGLGSPGGPVEAGPLPQILRSGDTKLLDTYTSAITGRMTTSSGGKNLTLIETKLFGGGFPFIADDFGTLQTKLRKAVSFFGRRIKYMEIVRGGPTSFGFSQSVNFDDPLPGERFEAFIGQGFEGTEGNYSAVSAQQPSGQFVQPPEYTDDAFVLETE